MENQMHQLSVIETMSPSEIYNSETLEQILKKISEEARAVPLDISSERGRKEIASLAYKISRSKTFLDDLGKKLGEDAQAKINAINADRRKARERLDALKDEIRKPLTDWESAEKNRVAGHNNELSRIAEVGRRIHQSWLSMSPESILQEKLSIESISRDWQEFTARAELEISTCLRLITGAYERALSHQAEQEELRKFREAEERRLQQERDERIAAEAAARAKQEAERLAKAEAERIAAEAERSRKKILEEKIAAEKRAADALAAKIAAEKRAEDDRERVAKEKEAAVAAERKRIESARIAAEAAEKARENNKRHAAKINNEALDAIVLLGVDYNLGKAIVSAIASGKVPNVRIIY